VGSRTASLPPGFKKLGYRGLKIVDREGLLFPQGTEIYIRGNFIFAVNKVSGKALWLKVPGLAQAEKSILLEFRRAFRF
jgi:hypothetical protein